MSSFTDPFEDRSSPLPSRMRGNVSRIVRAHAKSATFFRFVFGAETAADEVLRSRVFALRDANIFTVEGRAEHLHSLAVWLAVAAEALETESAAAAALRVELSVIIDECERITSPPRLAPARQAAAA